MERGTGGGGQHHQQYQQQQQQPQQQHYQQSYYHPHGHAAFMTAASDEHIGKSSFDNPATKKKPPKLKAINRSISMAIDNYDGPGGGGGPIMFDDSSLIVEQPIIHRSASPVALRSAPPQTLALPSAQTHGGGSGAVSPALSSRKHHHPYSFAQMAAQARQFSQQQSHSSSTSSPIGHGGAVSPLMGSSGRIGGGGVGGDGGGGGGYPSTASHAYQHQQHSQHQPDIYLVSSSSLVDDVGGVGSGRRGGSSASPIQFIDDYMLPPSHRQQQQQQQHATHPLKKSQFRRSDTLDIHPASTFQMKKTHSFHAPHDPSEAMMDPLLLSAAQPTSASSSRRTSSVRGNFLMPGHAGSKELSRSPSPSRRGAKSHRSLHDPQRRPSAKPESVVDSQIRHPSLNDDLLEPMDARSAGLLAPTNLSLENELFIESRSRSNSHTKMEDVGLAERVSMRKTSGSFEDPSTAHHPVQPGVVATSSLKKRDHSHSARQHSTHSLELDGRPSTSAAAAAAAAAAVSGGTHSTLHLHSAAAAATAAYHFKRGREHGRSLYLSPNNLEEVQVHHRPAVLAAAAAFGGTNASAATSIKQAKAMHSASMRLRTYRESLSATKKSKSFIGDSTYPPPLVSVSNEFVALTSPHRRNSGRALASATTSGGAATLEEIKRSPRPVSLGASTSPAGTVTTAFMEEKRPSFERKSSMTYELGDAAFEQVLRPFHHKAAAGIGTHEADDEEEADRKRKRIVCIVMTVFLCLVCAAVFVVIMTLTHSSGQSHYGHGHHGATKKINTYNRDVPVHYNVRQENERLMKESMERARFGKNYTEAASSLLAATTSSLVSAVAGAAGEAAVHHDEAYAQPLIQEQIAGPALMLPPPPQHQQQHHMPHLQQIP
ncbi:uncharacterized protein [Musca autumnalis]|uniref:uncharacterized protein n=1 Tax=Musca autumnalis TaxID=221902 RepID=UPI003CFBA3B2